MPATLRSTANTPTKVSGKPEARQDTPDSTPGRKIPHCRQCGRPRAGHQREGCSYASPASENTVTKALGELNLVTPEPTKDEEQPATPTKPRPRRSLASKEPSPKAKLELEDTEAAVRARRRKSAGPAKIQKGVSVASLSTDSEELVERLLHMSNASTQQDDVEGCEDQQLKATKLIIKNEDGSSPKPSRIMPGTLSTDNYISIADMSKRIKEKENFKHDIDMEDVTETQALEDVSVKDSTATSAAPMAAADSKESVMTGSSSSPIPKGKPLSRNDTTLSQQEFLSSLQPTSSSNARLYVFASKDVQSVRAGATKVNLFTGVINVSSPSDDTYLVIGKDEESVQTLVKELERDCKGKKGGGFKALAGGAIVGATAMFAGLAAM
jgi:hypothetical protein